jgi:peptide/nickel transport system substrate-binding protein
LKKKPAQTLLSSVLAAALLAVVLSAWGGGVSSAAPLSAARPTAAVAAATPAPGGSVNVLENSTYLGEWPGLDPATDSDDSANYIYMDAIYGDLFEQGANNQPVPDLATGYSFSNGGKTVTITLRPGVKFTDGTPFNAAAVKFNIDRDLSPANASICGCAADFPIASIQTPTDLTVVLQLTKVFAPIITAFYAEAPNWIVSPTALARLGEKAFSLTPVGAGPFQVVSDKPSSALQLARNPHYWQAGRPYLNRLTFTSIGSDESAYEALQAGQGQSYQRFSTYNLVNQAKQKLQLTTVPPVQVNGVQLNTRAKPFNNILAREAIYYATDAAAINKSLCLNQCTLTQSLTAPGGEFYEPTVPGYRTYNLAKAKALVKQLGGLDVTILVVGTVFDQEMAEGLQSQWNAAGMNVKLDVTNIGAAIQQYRSNSWEAGTPSAGDVDPSLGFGLTGEYLSTGTISGVSDPALDQLIGQATATTSTAARASIYKQAFKLISDKAYSPFVVVAPVYNLTVHGVSGPGLTTPQGQVYWEDVSAKS